MLGFLVTANLQNSRNFVNLMTLGWARKIQATDFIWPELDVALKSQDTTVNRLVIKTGQTDYF